MNGSQYPYLNFCKFNRAYNLGQTQTYAAGFRDQLFPVLGDIETKAEKAAQDAWEQLCSQPGYEDGPDLGDLAEQAEECGIQAYEELNFVRGQLIGLAIAGLYHLWERLLKEFLSRELAENTEKIQNLNFPDIVSLLEDFGWELRSESYFCDLETLSLVANTIKHGDGRSCKELAERKPDFFWPEAMASMKSHFPVRAENLQMEPKQFDLFSRTVSAFWEGFPEHLEYTKRD